MYLAVYNIKPYANVVRISRLDIAVQVKKGHFS